MKSPLVGKLSIHVQGSLDALYQVSARLNELVKSLEPMDPVKEELTLLKLEFCTALACTQAAVKVVEALYEDEVRNCRDARRLAANDHS